MAKSDPLPGQRTLGSEIMGYDVYRPIPKVIGLADFHIGNYRYPIRGPLVDLLKAHVMHMAMQTNPDVYLFAGDAFRTRTPTAQDYADFGEIISGLNAELIMIPGNHDIIGSREATTLDVFDEYDGVTLIKEPKVIQRNTFQVCCVPWLPAKSLSSFGLDAQDNSKAIRMLLDLLKAQLEPGKYSILLAHCTALGTEYHDGASTVLGNDVLWTSDMFSDFDLCVLGHIHKPQPVKGTDNAYYVGSPCPVSFNEASQKKTLFIFDGAPILKEIDAPVFVQTTVEELDGLEPQGHFYGSFLQIKKEHDDPDPEEIPECAWHEIVTLPPKRDVRQRVGEAITEMGPFDMLDTWLNLQEPDMAEDVLELARDLTSTIEEVE